MTTKEVHYVTGLSTSYINKVRTDNTKGLNEGTVNQVKWLLKLEVNYFDALFARAEFGDMCALVLKKATKRDHKNIAAIIRFTDKCYRRHSTLLKDFNVRGITDDDFSARELMNIYLADVKKLIVNPLFNDMCNVLLTIASRDMELRSFAAFLLDISDMMNDINRHKKEPVQ